MLIAEGVEDLPESALRLIRRIQLGHPIEVPVLQLIWLDILNHAYLSAVSIIITSGTQIMNTH